MHNHTHNHNHIHDPNAHAKSSTPPILTEPEKRKWIFSAQCPIPDVFDDYA